MRSIRHAIPMGVQDALGVECANTRRLESNTRDFFLRCGFQEIATPGIEYMRVFQGDVGRVDEERMFKFTDAEGRLLVMRPDSTLPIVRAIVTYYRETMLPVRLFYMQSAFQQQERFWENPQAGLEMLGDASAYADAEIIATAIQTLRETGLEHFQIDVGQVGFFHGLMEEAGLPEADIDELRRYVEAKNSLELEMLLRDKGLLRKSITALPMLYGEDAIRRARRSTAYPACHAALDNLETVLDLLEDWNLRQYVTVDLGMVHAVHYYSGIIFRGLAPGISQPVLSGGRYDELAAEFGRALPATGCALYLRQILAGLEKQGKLRPLKPLACVLGYEKGCHAKAVKLADALRAQGKRVELLHGMHPEEMEAARQERGASESVYVSEEKTC